MFSWLKQKKKKLKITEEEAMRQQWEKLQKRGKKKYIWVDGVVKYGVGIPTFIVLVDLLIGDNIYTNMGELIREYLRDVLSLSFVSFFAARNYWNTIENWTSRKKDEEEFDAKIDFCYFCGSEVGDSDICLECGGKLDG